MSIPVRNQPYTFTVALTNKLDPDTFLADPTIAVGDFKVKTDSGALANLANTPAVAPAGSPLVDISLTAAEMNGDKVNVLGSDTAAAPKWQDVHAFIDVPAGSVESVVDILDGDHDETNGRAIIYKKDTTDILVDKDITGSLLAPDVKVTTREHTP